MSSELWHNRTCETCGGSGLKRDYLVTCWDCSGTGTRKRTPTPADLLTDPRVAALVEAARRASHSVEDVTDYAELSAALTPFNEVSHG